MRIVHIALLGILLLLASPALADETKAAEVLVVNSYSRDHPWVRAHNDALRTRLAGRAHLDYCYLDAKLVPPDQVAALAEEAWKRAVELKPDVVVLTDDAAVKHLGMRLMERGIPVVFLGINENPRKYLGDMELATGVLERPLFKRSLLFLQDIMGPSLRHCLILFDDSETSRVIMDTIFHGHRLQRLGHTIAEVRLSNSFERWQQAVLAAKDNDNEALFIGLYHTLVDENGNHVPSEDALAWVSAHSPVPVFAYWDFAVGKGKAVGGLVNSGRPQGVAAADLVIQILDGRAPGTLYPVTPKDGQFLFSRHELERWHISLPDRLAGVPEPVLFVE